MSEEQKHTPGPWQWHYQGNHQGYTLICPHSGWLVVMDFVRHGMNMAQPRFAMWEGEERGNMGGIMRKATDIIPIGLHPDARLISAAPDLLKACEDALATNEEGMQPILDNGRLRDVLRAAIAKATGAKS